MNSLINRIKDIARSQNPSITAIGIIESVDPLKKTAAVRYMSDHGHMLLAKDAPIAMEPGFWAPGYKVGDMVELHFNGGNPLAPIVTKRIEPQFDVKRVEEWSSPAPAVYPEAMDGMV